jgi:hypothetical protein
MITHKEFGDHQGSRYRAWIALIADTQKIFSINDFL